MSTFFTRENLLRSLLTLGCFATVIFFFSPSWGAFVLWARVPEMSGMLEVRRGVSVLAQVAHPLAPVTDPLHQVVQWRLLFPVIGHVLDLPAPLFFSLADIGCLVVLAYIISLLRRHGADWASTALAGLILGAASWFFVSTGWLGYFDSWLALGLLVTAFARRSWPVWLACVLTPWVDERFVMAAPIALLCRWLWLTRATNAHPLGAEMNRGFSPLREFGIPAILVAVFLFVRLGLLSSASAANATVAGYFARNYLDAPFSRMLLGIWEGLRTGWIFVVAAVWLLRSKPAQAAVLGVAVILTIGAGLATAQDYSRSMTMLLPVAVLGALLTLGHDKSAATMAAPPSPRPTAGESRLLIGAAAAALLLPAHHVMNDRVNPIFYLYHELAAMETPPPTAMPELRELRAMHLMEQGDYAGAEHELTLAIKLAGNPASPARQRGMLYVSARRWEDARRDFTTVVENDPDNPDGWFLRAQVELAVRDNVAARSDFEHARAIAPAAWLERPDVKRFTALFNQQMGQR